MRYDNHEPTTVELLNRGRVIYGAKRNTDFSTTEKLSHHLGVNDLLKGRYAQYPNLWHSTAFVSLQPMEFGLLLFIMSETWEAGYDRLHTSGQRLRLWARKYSIGLIPSGNMGLKAYLDPLVACGAVEYIVHDKTNAPYTEILISRGTFLANNFHLSDKGRGIPLRKKDDPSKGYYNPKREKVYKPDQILGGILGNVYTKSVGLFARDNDIESNPPTHTEDNTNSAEGIHSIPPTGYVEFRGGDKPIQGEYGENKQNSSLNTIKPSIKLYEGKPLPIGEISKKCKFKNFMDMKDYLSENHNNFKDIPIEYEEIIWKIGKDGIPWNTKTVDDMPYVQRKRFWLYLMSNQQLLVA